MAKYQIYQVHNNIKSVVYHSLDEPYAETLVDALNSSKEEETYYCEPMNEVDVKDVDFSNEIVKDMKKEGIKNENFLNIFLKRKNGIRRALEKMARDTVGNRDSASNIDDLLASIDD